MNGPDSQLCLSFNGKLPGYPGTKFKMWTLVAWISVFLICDLENVVLMETKRPVNITANNGHYWSWKTKFKISLERKTIVSE